jgi:hypothetical protein
MSDLLKEAIADAKTVRETAIANAKMALEEAFTPHLKSMLSAKLAEDEYEDEEDEMEVPAEEPEMAVNAEEDPFAGEEEMEAPAEVPGVPEEEPEMEEEGVIEINGVKYAPVVAEEEGENPFAKDDEEEKELDLEAVIKELEDEISEQDDAYDEKAPSSIDGLAEEDDAYPDKAPSKSDVTGDKVDGLAEGDEEDEDDEKVDEQSDSSNIGNGDNVVNKADAGDEEDPGKGQVQESFDAMKAELKEHKEAVAFLREKLHEVNILNAKLLFTNRLFKEFVLSNDQKMKIVETFDRAQTTREIKLVYSTLAESFKGGSVKKNRVQESASVGTTKPTKKIITEESEVASRFKKLAGIIN